MNRNETQVEEDLVYRYLLGDLSEPEELALEQRLIVDDEAFERVWEIENRLVDCYVRGRLNATQKVLFEQNYLASAAHRERVGFAREFVEIADSLAGSQRAHPAVRASRGIVSLSTLPSGVAVNLWLRSKARRWAGIAAMLMLAVAAVWFLGERARLQKQITQLIEESAFQRQRTQELEREITAQRDRSDKLAAEIALLHEDLTNAGSPGQSSFPKGESHPVVSYLLSPMLMRGDDEAQRLKIARETQTVVLTMKVRSARVRTFKADLRTVEGADVWSKASISPRQQAKDVVLVSVGIAATKLLSGDYILTLSAERDATMVEEIGRYFFRVIKQ